MALVATALGAKGALAVGKFFSSRSAAKAKYRRKLAETRFNESLLEMEESSIEDNYEDQLKAMQGAFAMQQGQLTAALASQGVAGGGTASQLQRYTQELQNEDYMAMRRQFFGKMRGIDVQRSQLAIGKATAADTMRAEKTAAAFGLINDAADLAMNAHSAGYFRGSGDAAKSALPKKTKFTSDATTYNSRFGIA